MLQVKQTYGLDLFLTFHVDEEAFIALFKTSIYSGLYVDVDYIFCSLKPGEIRYYDVDYVLYVHYVAYVVFVKY